MKKFYTIDEAADYVAEKSGGQFSSHDIFLKAQSDELPVCFRIKDSLTGATIQNHNGMQSFVDPELPIDGIVSNLAFSGDENMLKATLVSIIQLNGLPVIRGQIFPVTEHPFRIKPGFTIKGMLNFVGVPSSEWLFFINDLQAISSQKTESANTSCTTGKRESVADQQNNAICLWLKNEGCTLKALPPYINGKSSIKATCRTQMLNSNKSLFQSTKVFNTAWQRLLNSKEIKYPPPDYLTLS